MVSPLQVVTNMPLFDVKSPGNVNTFNKYFGVVANFKVVDPNDLTEEITYVPEIEPVSLNF